MLAVLELVALALIVAGVALVSIPGALVLAGVLGAGYIELAEYRASRAAPPGVDQ